MRSPSGPAAGWKGLDAYARPGPVVIGTAPEQAAWGRHNGLALACYERGDFVAAVAHQRRAALAALHAPGPGHPDTIWTRFNLGRYHLALRDQDRAALALAERDFAAAARDFDAAGMRLPAVNTWVWRGQTLDRLGRPEAARPLLAAGWACLHDDPVLAGAQPRGVPGPHRQLAGERAA